MRRRNLLITAIATLTIAMMVAVPVVRYNSSVNHGVHVQAEEVVDDNKEKTDPEENTEKKEKEAQEEKARKEKEAQEEKARKEKEAQEEKARKEKEAQEEKAKKEKEAQEEKEKKEKEEKAKKEAEKKRKAEKEKKEKEEKARKEAEKRRKAQKEKEKKRKEEEEKKKKEEMNKMLNDLFDAIYAAQPGTAGETEKILEAARTFETFTLKAGKDVKKDQIAEATQKYLENKMNENEEYANNFKEAFEALCQSNLEDDPTIVGNAKYMKYVNSINDAIALVLNEGKEEDTSKKEETVETTQKKVETAEAADEKVVETKEADVTETKENAEVNEAVNETTNEEVA